MDIKIWQEKIKQKVKKWTYRDFLQNIASLFPLNLYKYQDLITIYPPVFSSQIKVIDSSNQWNIDLITKNYDFGHNFFYNWEKFFYQNVFPNIIDFGSNENSKYANLIYWVKNAYLTYESSLNTENLLYSISVKENCKNVLNSAIVWDSSENIYFTTAVIKSYNIFYSKYIHNSNNIWFCSNLIWCSECIFCDGLINKSYCINNIEYTKEDFYSKKYEILNKKTEFMSWYKKLKSTGLNIWSSSVEGNFIMDSENISNGFAVWQVKDWKNLFMVSGTKWDTNIYSCMSSGAEKCNDLYACFDCGISENVYFSQHIGFGYNIFYSYDLMWCSYCLGCVWLRNKKYCIFNTEYSEEERYNLAEKIFLQMEKDNILGEMIPNSLNPFYFNDTLAYIVWDFTRDEAIAKWYKRREYEIKVDIPAWLEIIDIDKLDISIYDESILKKVIKDKDWNYYRIVNMEYDFLKKYELPLPDLHWLDRMKLHFKSLNIK